ncbi:bifunctional diguanylate cyclase/phosphodiesterase [Dysosmobacter sp.]|uniref:bifunctional diguanylate cyclase/phosphodiesterase n=1 Tax=Dysosmobacter sp. TaxID=2591382 RepID=UPI003D8F0E12
MTYQIVDKVNGRIEQSVETLRMLRDSAILFESPQVESFLERKKSFAGYDDLRLFSTPEEAKVWLEEAYPGVYMDTEMALKGETQLLFAPDQDAMIYCVSDTSDEDLAVIIGIKTQETLKKLLNNECFNGQGTSFAVTRDGQTITTPGRMDLYQELRELQTGHTSEKNMALVEQMEADVNAGKSGTMLFEDIGAKGVMICYEPLDYSGWYIITIIPANIISMGTESLSNYNLFLTAIVIFLLFVSMLGLTISHQKNQKKLSQLAFCDELTGGMNDTSFRMTAQHYMKEQEGQYVLVSMDIQDFKMINQVYGTQEGNRTLRYVYRTLLSQLRSDEPMARNCGDVFFFLLKNRDKTMICTRLLKIYEAVNKFNQELKEPYYLELYFGIYQPESGDEPLADMQEKANIARKHKKGDDRYRYNFYDEEVQKRNIREKELMGMVDYSLRNGDFLIYLQPKVQLENNRVAGAEALIRWKHPELGMLSPVMFIPPAERYRLISKLDLFVFEEVCRTLARWKAEGRELLPISVNLSRQNMDTPNFLDDYRKLCKKYDVNPNLIEFELTETILFEDPQGIKCFIDEMHASGFQCSLDDFGTGFSALGLLNDLDVDAIKLDQSFFRGKNDTRRGRYIVESILRLAAQLHIRTVAEGIDELRQVEYLRQAACDMIQGFYFFKPMPVEEFEAAAYEDQHLRTLAPPQQDAGNGENQELSAAWNPSTEKISFCFPIFWMRIKWCFPFRFLPF